MKLNLVNIVAIALVIYGCTESTPDSLEVPDYYEVLTNKTERQLDDGWEEYHIVEGNKSVKEGPFRRYSSDRMLIEKGNYAENKKDGIWESYRGDSILDHIYFYKGGVLITEVDLQNDTMNKWNINEEKEGLWIESLRYRYSTGVYNRNLKVGIWDERIMYRSGITNWNLVESGVYVNDKRNGEWTYTYETNYIDPFVAFRVSRMKYQLYYKGGQLLRYQPDSLESLKDGNGIMRTSFPNGMVREEFNYSEGYKNGIGKRYDLYNPHDTDLIHYVLVEKSFSQGMRHGSIYGFDPYGKVTLEGTYKNGHRQGTWRIDLMGIGSTRILEYEDGIVVDSSYVESD